MTKNGPIYPAAAPAPVTWQKPRAEGAPQPRPDQAKAPHVDVPQEGVLMPRLPE